MSIPGAFRPETHPDYVEAAAGRRAFYGVVCRNCGAHNDDTTTYVDTVKKVDVSEYGYASVHADGTFDIEVDDFEDETVLDVLETRYRCGECDNEGKTPQEVWIANPESSEAELDSDPDQMAFIQSLVENRLIVFDETAWEEENAERRKALRERERVTLEQQAELLQAKLRAFDDLDS